MKIDINNYENYIMDFLEGNLPDQLDREMKAFLLLHPELEEDLPDIKRLRVQHTPLVPEWKDKMKKKAPDDRMDYYAIAASEGVLTDEEKKFVDKFCDRRSFDNCVEEYSAVKVKPDKTIHFPYKNRLYRKNIFPGRWQRITGIAAAVVLLMLVVLYRPGNDAGEIGQSFVVAEDVRPVSPFGGDTVRTEVRTTESHTTKVRDVPEKRIQANGNSPEKSDLERIEIQPIQPIIDESVMTIVSEILPPGPDEILYSPYNDESLYDIQRLRQPTEPRILNLFSDSVLENDNILNSLFQAGRTIANRIKNKTEGEL